MTTKETTVPTDTETPAEFDARMREALGLSTPEPVSSRRPWEIKPQAYQASPAVMPDPPTYDLVPALRPARVTQTRADLQRLVDAANQARDRLHALESEITNEVSRLGPDAVAADMAGKEPKPPRVRDYASERAQLEAVHRYRASFLRPARLALDAAIKDEAAAWTAALAAALEPARLAAEQALEEIQPALEAIRSYSDTVQAIAAAQDAAGRLTPRAKELGNHAARELLAATNTCAAELADPRATAWTTEPSLTPDREERLAMSLSGVGALLPLHDIEKGEEYAHTDYARPHLLALGFPV